MQNSGSKAEQERHEKLTGARWTELHRLKYFNNVRCTVVDPTHNLFLGTAKRMADHWIDTGLITAAQLNEIEQLAKTVLLPPGYEAVVHKIGAKFSFMKAAEWKSWCLVYSPLLLFNVLPEKHFTHWMKFVDAFRLLCKPSITKTELDEANELLLSFCRECEKIYSSSFITPNMHMHGHIKDTVLDFGSVYSFWLFSFERYNGMLSQTETNRKPGLEQTIACSFLESVHAPDFVRQIAPQFENDVQADILSQMISNPPTMTTAT